MPVQPRSRLAKTTTTLAGLETGPRHLERWMLRLMLLPLLVGFGYFAVEMVELWSGVTSSLERIVADAQRTGG